jgi:hypothetical protein
MTAAAPQWCSGAPTMGRWRGGHSELRPDEELLQDLHTRLVGGRSELSPAAVKWEKQGMVAARFTGEGKQRRWGGQATHMPLFIGECRGKSGRTTGVCAWARNDVASGERVHCSKQGRQRPAVHERNAVLRTLSHALVREGAGRDAPQR